METKQAQEALEAIPGQTGVLILAEDGKIEVASGELQEDSEESAVHLRRILLDVQGMLDAVASKSPLKKVEVTFESEMYSIGLIDKKIFLVKIPLQQA